MTSQSPMLRRNFKGGAFMEQQLAYSFHLGSDKNKTCHVNLIVAEKR